MPTVDEILASSPLAGLRRVSRSGGDRDVTVIRLAERFADLDNAPHTSLVVLSRSASAEVTDYRLDMALRWASVHRVAAVAAFSAERWRPTVTVTDIAGRADIALISIPPDAELTELVQALMREIGGGADRALGRAQQGLDAVLAAEEAGADLNGLCTSVGVALGTVVEFRPAAPGQGGPSPNGQAGKLAEAVRSWDEGETGASGAEEASVPVVVGEAPIGYLAAPHAHGDLAVAARLVLNTAALAAARVLDLDEAEPDEVERFGILESAGQLAMQAAAATGGTWYLSRVARAIMLIRVTGSSPGPQAGMRAARSAGRALQAIGGRMPALRFRAGVGSPHEGPMGLRASAAEARGALLAARSARKPPGVAAYDVVGVQRMLMEWYSSDTARASVRDQLAPLEKLGPGRAETAIQTLAAYLDEQGSLVKTAQKLHLHRNAVANRLRGITELLDVDLDDPDQRLALQLACRARLLA